MVALYLRSAAKKTQSPLVELDAKSWTIDGLLTLAVLIAFASTMMIEKSEYAWMADYADPVIVATLVVLVIPVPYITIRDNIKQLLLGAPDQEMQIKVHELLAPELEKIDKQDYLVRMAKIGRFLYIQIFIQLTPQSEARDINSQDTIRQRISEKLTSEFSSANVDIIFTMERKWFGNITEPV